MMVKATVSIQTPASNDAFYKTWLNADDLRQWLGEALRGMNYDLSGERVRVELDPRVGGSFYYSDMRDGQETPHWGTYLELVSGKRVVFTWFPDDTQPVKSLVTIDIEDHEQGSLVKSLHDLLPEWSEFAEQTEAGWESTVKACGAFAAARGGSSE